MRQFEPTGDELKSVRDRSLLLHTTLRDWIEQLLPKSKADLEIAFPSLAPALTAELVGAGLTKARDEYENFAAGFVFPLKFNRPEEDRDKLVLVAGVGMPCGRDDVVYVYDYSGGERRRILESGRSGEHDESILGVYVSDRSPDGSQQILTTRYGVQCGSSWNVLSYDLFRTAANQASAQRIFAEEHEFWNYEASVRLKPDELLIEFEGSASEGGFRRTHVRHFSIADQVVSRIDPVALLPGDFVDEWLKEPWPEMQARSGSGEELKKWHALLGDGSATGTVQPCSERANHWLIELIPKSIQGKELPEELSVFFLVQEIGEHRYKMIGISFDRQDGCPGDSYPDLDVRPSLFPRKK